MARQAAPIEIAVPPTTTASSDDEASAGSRDSFKTRYRPEGQGSGFAPLEGVAETIGVRTVVPATARSRSNTLLASSLGWSIARRPVRGGVDGKNRAAVRRPRYLRGLINPMRVHFAR